MIPVLWLSKEGVCSRCRMDEWFVEDLLDGAQKHPAQLPYFEHHDEYQATGDEIVVVVLPGGNHVEDIDWVNEQLAEFHEVILIITSDEGAHFPVEKLSHPRLILWVQTPRPEVIYPLHTEFFGVGSGRAWKALEIPNLVPVQRTIPLFFSGQKTHERRDSAIANAHRVAGSEVHSTKAFMEGMPRERYLGKLCQTHVAPAPSGVETQDSFRFYEALECGAVPVPDGKRQDGGGRGYWDLVAPLFPVRPMDDWRHLPSKMGELKRMNIQTHAWWHWRRRDLAVRLGQRLALGRPSHPITVVMPTSPIPSHPAVDMIDETIASIRERTQAEILIMVDAPRPEMVHRQADYDEYVSRLLTLSERHWWNVTPIVHHTHLHQAELLRRTIQNVGSEFLLFMEHDTPLIGDIDFERVVAMMDENRLNLMRFYHETEIHEEHEWLMAGPVQDGWRPTMQWSQRPHVARARWYERKVLLPHFTSTARVMIEDVMFGVVEHGWRVLGPQAWDRWRLAIYHPEGNIKRSTHLDGRETDPKFEDRFKYRYPHGEVPPGAPNPAIGI